MKIWLNNMDKHFRGTKIINFDVIQREYWGVVVPPELLQYYRTVNEKTVSQYRSPEQNQIWSSGLRIDRKDIFFEKKSNRKPFKYNKNILKNQKKIFVKVLFNVWF